ncbi:FHA domain-containing protein [Pseudooceanicola sp. LIPI14-2-Ac024]|uniref:FHA domain-containing protein n=1 Tax=Pseudooceanicola sp. LIPI14-2-Ac024 TaxID=3344875 RepID=UPI0035D04A9D
MIRMKDIIARRRPPLSGGAEETTDDAMPTPDAASPERTAPITRFVHEDSDQFDPDLFACKMGRDAKPWRLPDPDWGPAGTPGEAAEALDAAEQDTFDEDGFVEDDLYDDDLDRDFDAAEAALELGDEPPADVHGAEDPLPPLRQSRPHIWDVPEERAAEPEPEVAPAPIAAEPAAPAARPTTRLIERPSPRAAQPAPAAPEGNGRVKTRLLGFHAGDVAKDVFAAPATPAPAASTDFPVGWVVVVDGPGRGASFTLTGGLSTIGRSADQTISLDHGDESISRNNHASIAYDEEDNTVYVGHGGKSNIVRLNGRPLLSTEELQDGDLIRIGKTTLRFVSFCGPDFSWTDDLGDPAAGADVE